MKVHSPGVLPASNIFFYTPSYQATKLFFYILCTGHYFCDRHYLVDRQRYDSFLILFVLKGRGFVETGDRDMEIGEGSVAFIDCYKPHKYYTKTGWETLWIHFDGRLARDYHDAIVKNGGCVIAPPAFQAIERKLQQIYGLFNEVGRISEPAISQYITTILMEFFIGMSYSALQEHHNAIEEILPYIAENIDKPLTVEELAARACLSPFYFTRVFKKETGLTPHKYIITARINLAKFLLRTTDFSVKKIALSCGYTNVCNFCSSFKQITGTPPLEFRSRFGTV